MDAVLCFRVSNQEIERTDEFVVVEGSDNYLQARFEFTTDDWEGLIKTGIFIDEDGTVHRSLCADDVCDVPPEWLKEQKGAIGVLGSDGITKITTRTVTIRIKPKGYTGDGTQEEEAKIYFDQIMQAFSEAKEYVSGKASGAEMAESSAEAWAHGHESYPERDEDNAKYYARKAEHAAAEIPGKVENAKKLIDEYVSEKETELKGETGNVYFAAFKVVGGRLKMYSDPTVDKVHFYRAGSRLKYRIAT